MSENRLELLDALVRIMADSYGEHGVKFSDEEIAMIRDTASDSRLLRESLEDHILGEVIDEVIRKSLIRIAANRVLRDPGHSPWIKNLARRFRNEEGIELTPEEFGERNRKVLSHIRQLLTDRGYVVPEDDAGLLTQLHRLRHPS